MKRHDGKVKWFNEEKGFGFIERKGLKDLFVHYKGIDCEGRRTLLEGQVVLFEIAQTEKGEQAIDVSVIA